MITKIIGLLVCFLLQASCRKYLLFSGIAPDFIILGLVLAIKKNDLLDGTIYGAGCGLFYDLISYGTFGAGVFTLTISGFIIAFLKKHVFSDNVFSKILITLIITLVSGFLSLSFLYLFYTKINVLSELLRITLPLALSTSFVLFLAVVIYYLSKGNVKKAFG